MDIENKPLTYTFRVTNRGGYRFEPLDTISRNYLAGHYRCNNGCILEHDRYDGDFDIVIRNASGRIIDRGETIPVRGDLIMYAGLRGIYSQHAQLFSIPHTHFEARYFDRGNTLEFIQKQPESKDLEIA